MKKVYLYRYKNNLHELYLGGYSLIDCLSILNYDHKLVIKSFGANCYLNYGFATEKELPRFRNVGEFTEFLKQQGDIGIVDCEIEIDSFVLSTHDDNECTFQSQSKSEIVGLMNLILPDEYKNILINKLLINDGIYIVCDKNENIKKFASFDKYLESLDEK